MCLLSKALGKTILWAYIIGTFLPNERDTSPEFFGLSFSALECCVPAYGALKLAVKAGITSCWPGFYLVCAVFLKNRNLHIKAQMSTSLDILENLATLDLFFLW